MQSSLNLDIPVKYIGVGESIDDLQKFDADAFVNALFDVHRRKIRMYRSQTYEKIEEWTETMLTLESFEEAVRNRKTGHTGNKAGIQCSYFSEQTGNKVYLKPENMQFTGAYKVRGAYYKISTLSEEETSERSDHSIRRKSCTGCGLCCAKCYGVKAVIVMPTTTPLIKVRSYQELRCRGCPVRRCI